MGEFASVQTADPRAGHLRRLTSLRAFAALFVLTYHLGTDGGTTGPLHSLTRYGYTGVAFFFVLSGFVLTWTYNPGPKRAFYLRRFARIYPSHFVMLLVAVAVPVTEAVVTPKSSLLDTFLVQAWLPGTPFSGNSVSWSLSCEVAFYLVLPLILARLLRLSSRNLVLVTAAYFSACSIAVFVGTTTGQGVIRGYTWPPVRFGEFLIGVSLAIVIQRGWRLTLPVAAGAIVVGAGLIAAVTDFPAPNVGSTLIYAIVVAAGVQCDLGGKSSWLTSPVMLYLGRVSFAFYLVHDLVMINLTHALPHWSGALRDPVLIIASCIAAVILHHVVERPCERRIRQLKLPGMTRPVAATPLSVDS